MRAAGVDRRVVVTGVGLVTPFGGDARAIREAVARGETAVAPATRFDGAGFGAVRAAEVRDLDCRPYMRLPKALKLCDGMTRFAIVAAARALADGGMEPGGEEAEGVGVILGASGCDVHAGELSRALGDTEASRCVEEIPLFAKRILSDLNPLWLLRTLPNMTSAQVSIQLGARGPNSTVMTDWIAGLQAIGEGALWIRSGEADAVLAGGADTAVNPFVFGSLAEAGVFDGGSGEEEFVPSEGAAVFLLEEAESAKRRGASVRAEIVGYAASCHDPAEPDSGLAATMRRALRQAGWAPSELDAVCRADVPLLSARAHEERALSALLAVRPIPAAAGYRGALGHAFAAANPIDLALSLDALEGSAARFLANSVGFGGQAVTLALRAGV